ncbi:hypothetical protein Pst134EA_000724 [Puccinia striiformis f. sp. tritici]|uniref:hypothetical protein n=1 Tax=Puccinia striiformis f. sp. tritici TaxID=168172 RepID=UPI0020088101|nr:hypothetical protein Pst134EA_000724 [Puccinia striiformis f. sp. tritici]KAH9473644.1 hypothetical protein Pst134EA_000724 [Puccinia striiformis f. sp. tritici]
MSDQSEDSLVEFDWQVRCQGSLVIEVFGRLESRCDLEWPHCHEATSASTTEEALGIESKEVLYDRLHRCLSPILRQHITTFLSLLDAEGLQKEPESRLKLLSELAPEIDLSMTEIISAVTVICPVTFSATQAPTDADRDLRVKATPFKADDYGLKQFKVYRLAEIRKRIDEQIETIAHVFYQAHEHIRRLGLSTSRWISCSGEELDLEEATDAAFYTIDLSIEYLKGSDLDIAEDCWHSSLHILDRLLENALGLVVPSQVDVNPFLDPGRKLNHEPVINLARSATPIIKLSRLFFNKLSSKGMNRPRSFMGVLYTEMDSNQLKDFCDAAHLVSHLIINIFCSLTQADMNFDDEASRTGTLIEKTELVASHFDDLSLLVVRYLIPLVQKTDALPDQNYYNHWFDRWNTQFKLAIHQFSKAVENI